METELKSCPFCGGKVRMNHNIELVPDGIYCPTCHMKVNYTRELMKNKEQYGAVMARIAEAWNRRAAEESEAYK